MWFHFLLPSELCPKAIPEVNLPTDPVESNQMEGLVPDQEQYVTSSYYANASGHPLALTCSQFHLSSPSAREKCL